MLDAVIPYVYAGGALLLGALAVDTWRRREVAASRPLVGLLLSVTVWLLASLGSEFATEQAVQMYWWSLALLGLGCTVAFLFLFALRYAGYDGILSGRRALVLGVHPVLVAALSLTNVGTGVSLAGVGGHALVYESVFTQGTTAIGVEWGPGFWVHLAYSYALVAASTVLVGRAALRSNDRYRGQTGTVLAAILVPWFANALDLAFASVDGLLVVGFCIAGLLLTVSVHRYDLTDVVPVARPVVMEAITDGVVVVDGGGRVVDANDRAWTLLELDGGDPPIGAAATDALPEPVLSALDTDADRERVRLCDRVVEVETTPFRAGEADDGGTVLVLRDVTDEHAYRTELERKTERLDRFASVVSHDLRNPLSVAKGYADLAAESGDVSHLQEVRSAHERMEALIEDVLLLAQEGETTTDPERVGLDDVAERAWETVDTGGTRLSVADTAVLRADPLRTVQLFENCYRNAVEAGAGEVEVGILREGGSPTGFYVADDGPGIPEEVADDLFETGVSGGDGTGIGLAIVQRIAGAHGWDVAATTAEAGGACFEFTGVTFPESVGVVEQASP